MIFIVAYRLKLLQSPKFHVSRRALLVSLSCMSLNVFIPIDQVVTFLKEMGRVLSRYMVTNSLYVHLYSKLTW